MSADESIKLDHQLCFALYAASNAMTRLYRDRLEPLGLTYPQYLVMLLLWEQQREEAAPHTVKNPHTVKSLGERLHLDSGTLTPMLKRMEQAGLITRSRAAQDERQVTIALTEQGSKLEAAVAAAQREMACLLPLSRQDLARLRTELRRLAAGLQAETAK